MTVITDTVKKRQSGQQRILQKSFILLLALAVVIIAVLAGVIVWQYFQKSATDQVRAPFSKNINLRIHVLTVNLSYGYGYGYEKLSV